MIVKLQRPIVTAESPERFFILAYNEDRSLLQEIDSNSETLDEIFADEFKVYADCEIDKDGNLSVNEVIEDQDW